MMCLNNIMIKWNVTANVQPLLICQLLIVMVTTVPLWVTIMMRYKHSRPVPHLHTMMKNLMRSKGSGVLLFSSVIPDRCTTLSHSFVLMNTRTSLGSKGTSELQSSSLGDGRGEKGRQLQRAKGCSNRGCVYTWHKLVKMVSLKRVKGYPAVGDGNRWELLAVYIK